MGGRKKNVYTDTKAVQHLVAFIQNKVLAVLQRQVLLFGKLKDSARGSNDDVGLLIAEKVLVGRNGNTTIKHSCLEGGNVFPETIELMANLES